VEIQINLRSKLLELPILGDILLQILGTNWELQLILTGLGIKEVLVVVG
jgi:hypothetical protein